VPIKYDNLLARSFPEVVQSYTWRHSILYALGIGLGSDPVDPGELRFVYEQGLEALPTMAVVLGDPGFWINEPDTGIDFGNVVHGEQSLTIHAPLPAEGTLIARNMIDEIVDKGKGRGAIVRVRRDLYDQRSGALQSSQVTSMFCRADGGFGGPSSGKPTPAVEIPDRAPDHAVSRTTLPQAALIYRLSGDFNPIHIDPEAARGAGFDRPILHGLATFGIAGYAVLATCAGGDVTALRELGCRFSAPIFPGETLRMDIWDEPEAVLFRCTAVERNQVVLNQGRAVFA